jgi:hypothetical protein
MENPVKINRLAIVGFSSGLVALLSLGLYWGLSPLAYPSSPEPVNNILVTIMDLSVPVRNLCALVALITGFLALRDIKKKAGIEKGKIYAWVGMLLGAGWILFGLLIGGAFLVAEILH